MQNSETLIELKNIRKNFGELEVLKGIDLSVKNGEIICIIGPSGSGKSTLIRCLNLLEDFEGEYYFAGQKVDAKVGPHIFRRNFGMVFQHFNLFPHKNVLENIIEGPIQVLGQSKQDAIERADGLLRRVGLEDKRKESIHQLSGGQKQRVAIARALAMNPKVLLFDEPTSALDPEKVNEVLEVIRDISEEKITTLIVTHEIQFAKQVSHRIIFLEEGLLAAQGRPDELLDSRENNRLNSFLNALK